MFAPLLDSVTAPVKALLAFVKVIALAPAEKLAVPDIAKAFDCTMEPPVETDRLLVLVRVVAAKESPALLSVIVRLFAPVMAPPNVIVPLPRPPNVLTPYNVIGLLIV